MIVRFTKDVKVEKISNICCFSGICDIDIVYYAKGYTIDIAEVGTGCRVKRRHKEGGPYTVDKFILNDDRYGFLHPNEIRKIRSCDYEVFE
jgi:hypothetical protein